ncbi:TraR/DksA family transcriptional regulator [Nannocystaceae bacterium ST9]
MDHLGEAQLTTLRARLDQEAKELRERIAERSMTIAEGSEGDLRDIEDKAAREGMRFQAMRQLTREQARLAEVEAALARMDAGEYGICEESDEPIPFRRLELDPATRYTAEAQAEVERERAQDRDDPTPDEPIGY